MAKILYVYNDQVYANITNKCDCNCTFCIRKQFDGVGDADTLWHKAEPSLSEIIAAIDAFDFTGYKEFVFCGYGEPTCALENLIASARYVKEKTGLPIRVNSNGLGNLYYKRDIVPELAEVVDSISISLNEANAEKYEKVTRPSFPHAYEAMLDFAEECGKLIPHTQLSIVDILPEEDIRAHRRQPRCPSESTSMGAQCIKKLPFSCLPVNTSGITVPAHPKGSVHLSFVSVDAVIPHLPGGYGYSASAGPDLH